MGENEKKVYLALIAAQDPEIRTLLDQGFAFVTNAFKAGAAPSGMKARTDQAHVRRLQQAGYQVEVTAAYDEEGNPRPTRSRIWRKNVWETPAFALVLPCEACSRSRWGRRSAPHEPWSLEGAADGVPATPDSVLEALPGAGMPPFPALTEPRFQRPPVVFGEALAHVIAIAIGGLVLHVGQAALRLLRRLLMLAEGCLGARQAWRVEGPWRPMARGVTLGDHSPMAQVRPLGPSRWVC